MLPVPIARPRDRVSIVEEPAFRTIQERLMALLTAEAIATA